MAEEQELEENICNLAHFFKGSASFEWLESQPLSKIFRLIKQANKIIKRNNESLKNGV